MKKILIVEGQRNIAGGQRMTLRICHLLREYFEIQVYLPDGKHDLGEFLSDFNQCYYVLNDF